MHTPEIPDIPRGTDGTAAGRTIRVLYADASALLRNAITALLAREPDIEVVAALESGDQLIAAAEKAAPDVVLLDIRLPGPHGARDADGIAAASAVTARLPHCRALILTALTQPAQVRRALAANVGGFLHKEAPVSQLATDIRRVVAGERVIDPALALAAASAGDNPLTPREMDVLRLLADGASPREIAGKLHISLGTARNHLASAVAKTHARTRLDAVRVAREAGWT